MDEERSALPSRLRPAIQIAGILRKELVDIVRQPRILVVLVAGPFLILLAFAGGYDENSTRLRTVFVGPEGSIYETAVESYGEDIGRYVETVEFTNDVVRAEGLLSDGDADLVVVFPPDPVEKILAGEHAVISVLHDKLDPIQQTAVEISAKISVQELNATVLEELVGEAQQAMAPIGENLDEVDAAVGGIDAAAAADDDEQLDELGADLRASLAGLDTLTSVSNEVVGQLRGEADPEQRRRLDEFRSTLASVDAELDELDRAETAADARSSAARLSDLAAGLRPQAQDLLVLDPGLVSRPFASDTENLLRQETDVKDFFTPSAISLLLQHLGLTFAALTLVRDRSLGLFETFRVGPVAARHVLAGKYVAFLLLGGAVGAALVAAVVLGLDVPLRGSPLWLALGVGLLVASSVGLGLVISSLAQTDTQAVQFAMLLLLAGMFFGGFFLSLDAFRYPVKLVSWLLPVTYAIRLLQDVMLRGVEPAVVDLAGLGVLTVGYGALAWHLFSRALRVR